jgi:pyrroloquinoline-quinone synthase
MNTYLDSLDQLITARHLLLHPFYLAWTRGELHQETLADYARQYYQHVAAFPTYLSAVYARCEDQPTRRQLLANLIDEEAGEPNHPQLWRRFAEALGVSPNDIETCEAWPETAQLIATFRSICSQIEVASGLAALYAYESQIPAVSQSKIDGLKKHYGFTDPEGYRYFTVHIEADRAHAAAERALLEKHIRQENSADVTRAAERVLSALWELLSGVCRRHELAC